jgi:FkbM family methyltransferase
MSYKSAKDCQITNLFELYTKYFNDKVDGYFVEIGAHNGFNWSNTWGLAEAGWNGIYIEPIHQLAEDCKEMHKNNKVIVLECAATDHEGMVKLWLSDADFYDACTLNESIAANELARGWGWKYSPEKFIEAYGMKLDTILCQHKVPANLDLIVIDVEGGEPSVLSGFNADIWRPKMMIIESAFNFDWITNWTKSHLYDMIQNDGVNAIYITDKL